MLNDECRDLPLVIIRPSIVCASIDDPLPGWIDNYNGMLKKCVDNLTPALKTPVSKCAEYKKVYISAFNGNIRQKIS